MQLPPHVVDRIRAWVANTPKQGHHVDHEAARHGGLSLMGTIGSTWLLKPDGTFWDVDDDFGKTPEALSEELHLVALVSGVERHPWLAELLPARSEDAHDCLVCAGTGRLALEGSASGFVYCDACSALGWTRGSGREKPRLHAEERSPSEVLAPTIAPAPSNPVPSDMTPATDTVIHYLPEQRRTNSSAVAWYVLVSPLLVLLVMSFFSRELAWPAAILTTAALLWRRRKAKTARLRVIEIVGKSLVVRDHAGTVLLDAPMEEIGHVSLDTKTIENVQESMASGMPELRFVQSQVGPAIDNSRIEIHHGDSVLLLTEEYTSNIDASDWALKIRRMLRKHGWVPLSERDGGFTTLPREGADGA